MTRNVHWFATVVVAAAVGAAAALIVTLPRVSAQPAPALSAADYQEIAQLTNRYAYGIDTCGNNGYDYADVFTPDGEFIDRNSDAGFKAGGRVLAKGREALATLIGGGSRGCKTKLVWTDWSHIMTNLVVTPTAAGATGRLYLLQMDIKGPGTHRAPRRLRGRVREERRPAGASGRGRTSATKPGTHRPCRPRI